MSGIFCIPTAWHVLVITFMNAKVGNVSQWLLDGMSIIFKNEPQEAVDEYVYNSALLSVKTFTLNFRSD